MYQIFALKKGILNYRKKDMIFDSRVLRRIFGPEWKEITEK